MKSYKFQQQNINWKKKVSDEWQIIREKDETLLGRHDNWCWWIVALAVQEP